MTELEMLNYALENGMLDMNTIQAKIQMNKEQEIISNHPYSIWQGKDGKWRTKVVVNDKKKLIKKSTEEAIRQAILDHYKQENEYSFKNCYRRWIERQRNLCRSENTLYRYKTDYIRFFEDTEFEKKPIDEISEETIASFIKELAESKKLNYKCIVTIFGYIKGVFEKQIRDKIITDNPCDYVDLLMLKKFCTEKKPKTAQERTLSDSERQRLEQKLENKSRSRPKYIPQYAVHLSMYTGFRVGELAGLKWEDVFWDKKCIVISRSEKYNRKTKKFFIDDTKNHLVRSFPMTDKIESILKKVWKIESENGWLQDFVFADEKGKIHTNVISSAMRNYTLYDSTFSCAKSIHANRRTLNSNMRCNGVSATIASSLLGHTERVNEDNYTYDVADTSYKLQAVEKAGYF